MTSASVLIADFQCFVNNEGGYIVKELSIFDYTFQTMQHWMFKPPKLHYKLSCKAQRTNCWLTKCFHKIKWDDGEVEYEVIRDIFKYIDDNFRYVLVKGCQKRKFLLKNLYNCSVIDLEEYGCPKIALLPMLNDSKHCIKHNLWKEKCTQYSIQAINSWLDRKYGSTMLPFVVDE